MQIIFLKKAHGKNSTEFGYRINKTDIDNARKNGIETLSGPSSIDALAEEVACKTIIGH